MRRGLSGRTVSTNLIELQRALESPRQELFRRLNLARREPRRSSTSIRLLRGLTGNPAWAAIEFDLAQLLRSWFNGGFLELRRIDWRTPEVVLQNLMKNGSRSPSDPGLARPATAIGGRPSLFCVVPPRAAKRADCLHRARADFGAERSVWLDFSTLTPLSATPPRARMRFSTRFRRVMRVCVVCRSATR